jgi:hypothetical protein
MKALLARGVERTFGGFTHDLGKPTGSPSLSSSCPEVAPELFQRLEV